MATLQSFYPWVSVDCSGVPSLLMDDAIRRGAREFCKATHAIESDVQIASVANQTDYQPTLPTGTEIVSVKHVKQGTTYLAAEKLETLERYTVSSTEPNAFTVVETNPLSIRLYPTPVSVKTYDARFVLMPTVATDEVDDKLFDWYLEGVTSYAKYWLMIQPGKDWTNAEQAAFEYNRFMAKCSDTRVRRGQWRSDLTNQVQMSPFA